MFLFSERGGRRGGRRVLDRELRKYPSGGDDCAFQEVRLGVL